MLTIGLTQGKTAIVGEQDYPYLAQWKWYANCQTGGMWYACRTVRLPDGKRVSLRMHRIVAERSGLDISDEIDHIDGNGLNNVRSNLRAASHRQNVRNRRPNKRRHGLPKGAYRLPSGRYQASITVDDKQVYIGSYDTEDEAAAAYDAAARELHGEFACLNNGAADD